MEALIIISRIFAFVAGIALFVAGVDLIQDAWGVDPAAAIGATGLFLFGPLYIWADVKWDARELVKPKS